MCVHMFIHIIYVHMSKKAGKRNESEKIQEKLRQPSRQAQKEATMTVTTTLPKTTQSFQTLQSTNRKSFLNAFPICWRWHVWHMSF